MSGAPFCKETRDELLAALSAWVESPEAEKTRPQRAHINTSSFEKISARGQLLLKIAAFVATVDPPASKSRPKGNFLKSFFRPMRVQRMVEIASDNTGCAVVLAVLKDGKKVMANVRLERSPKSQRWETQAGDIILFQPSTSEDSMSYFFR